MIAAASIPLLFDQRADGGVDTMVQLEEFENLVRSYQNMVFSVAVRITGSHADAEDIAQEVFLKAYERYGELRQTETIGGWLKTVATNLSINHLNRYRARWRFFSEQETEPDIPAPPENTSDRREMVELLIRKLPDSQRVPLVLYHFQELSYDEIAQELGISLAKVKTDIHRGRETLRKLLQASHE